MRKFFSALVVIPLGLLFIVFAVANRHWVTVSFDPFDAANPSVAVTMQPSTLGIGIGSSPSPASVARESVTIQNLKSNITAEVSNDDLDVPAFIRKRGDA